MLTELVGNEVARVAFSAPGRVSSLSYKIGDNAVERGAVVKLALGQGLEVIYMVGGHIREKAEDDLAQIRGYHRYIVIRFHHKADWIATFHRHPDIFGAPRA
jgi:hypothetical protein